MIDTEILHFGHSGAKKIEFEVGRSNFKNLEKCQIFFIFYWEDILSLKHSLQSK